MTESLNYDDSTGEYHATFDPDTTEPSVAVTLAVAEAEGVEVEGLDTMNDTIDGEALDEFLGGAVSVVVFEYNGYDVTVTGSGEISLRD